MAKIIKTIAAAVCIVGVIMFFVGSTTGTVTGYKGANGQYYSYPDSVGSRDWMIMPGFFMGLGGGFVAFAASAFDDDKKK